MCDLKLENWFAKFWGPVIGIFKSHMDKSLEMNLNVKSEFANKMQQPWQAILPRNQCSPGIQ